MTPDELNRTAREEHPDGATLEQRAAIAKRGYQPTPHVCQFCETPLRDHWWDPCTYTPPEGPAQPPTRRAGVVSADCGICSHRNEAHQAANSGCEVRYVDGARCYCPGYQPRITIHCGTCNGSGIAPDYSPEPDDEQPCPECVTEEVR